VLPAAEGAAGQPDPKQVLTPKGSRMATQAGVEERVQMPLKWGTRLMAMCFMIGGLFRIVTPIVMHLPHRGWLLLSGVVTLLLSVYI
jgi:hypothetical protein